MIQSRNKYLQFMLVLLAAWAIAWGAMFVMGQAVLLYGLGKNTLFFSHGAVLVYLLCVFLVYRRWVAPLPVVGQLSNVGALWLVGAMAVVYADHLVQKAAFGKSELETLKELAKEFGRKLLYVPYAPCRHEHFILSGRSILADQMEYLKAQLPAHSRWSD